MDKTQMAQDILGELIEVLSDAVMERVSGPKPPVEDEGMEPMDGDEDELGSRLMAASSGPPEELDDEEADGDETPFPKR